MQRFIPWYRIVRIVNLVFAVIGFGLLIFVGYFLVSGSARPLLVAKVGEGFVKYSAYLTEEVANLPFVTYRWRSSSLPRYTIEQAPNRSDVEGTIERTPGVLENIGWGERLLEDGETKAVFIHFQETPKIDGARPHVLIPLRPDLIAEELMMQRARTLGLPVPQTRFVAVSWNGRDHQVYWEISQFSEETQEKYHLRNNATIVREARALEPWWQEALKQNEDQSPFLALTQLTNGTEQNVHDRIFTLFDQKNFYTWSVLSRLNGGRPMDTVDSLRLLYDPTTRRFSLLPWDLGLRDVEEFASDTFIFESTAPSLAQKILSQDTFVRERNALLLEYLTNTDQRERDLVYVQSLIDAVLPVMYADGTREMSFRHFVRETERVQDLIKGNMERLHFELTRADVSAILKTTPDPTRFSLELHARQLSPFSLARLDISLAGTSINPNFSLFDASGKKVCSRIEKEMQEEEPAGGSISVFTQFKITCDPQSFVTAIDRSVPRESVDTPGQYTVYRPAPMVHTLTLVSQIPLNPQQLQDLEVQIHTTYGGVTVTDIPVLIVDEPQQ